MISGLRRIRAIVVHTGKMIDLVDVQLRDFLLPVCFGFVASVLKLVTLVLFLPLVFGLLGGDFSRLDRILPLSSIFDTGNTQVMIWSLSSAILLAAIASGICDFAANMLAATKGDCNRSALGQKLLEAYLRYGQQYFDINRFGNVLAKASRLSQRATQLFRFLNNLFKAILSLTLYLLAMAWFSLPLTLMVIVLLMAYLYAFNLITARIDTLGDRFSEAEDKRVAVASDLIMNLPLLHLAGAERQAVVAFSLAEEAVHRARMEESRVEAAINPLRELLTMVVILVFAVIASRYAASINVGVVSRYIVFFLLLRRSMGHFATILSALRRWSKLKEKFDKLFELLNEDGKFLVPSGSRQFPGLGDGIVMRHLNFSYVGKGEVLHDIALKIPAGRRTVIVGATGSGKSTLFRLLLRQYDCPAGSIFVNGMDLRDLDTAQWLKQVTYAGAHPQFFNDTIRNNLTIGLQNIAEETLEDAAIKASALEFIQQFELGFDHAIGDRGVLLSSGEQQRLALARLFLRNAQLVLLDEATSALDNTTEARIMRSIDDFALDRTLVMIAHRLSSLQAGDHVIVLQDGRVVEQGNRDDLLSDQGVLTRLWQIHEGVEP